MPNHSPLRHKSLIVAGQSNVQDFLDYLTELQNAVADVRTNIGTPDTTEIRKAMGEFLGAEIDKLKRMRKNEISKISSPSYADDD